MRAHTGRGRLSIKDGTIGQSATPCYGGGLGGSERKERGNTQIIPPIDIREGVKNIYFTVRQYFIGFLRLFSIALYYISLCTAIFEKKKTFFAPRGWEKTFLGG